MKQKQFVFTIVIVFFVSIAFSQKKVNKDITNYPSITIDFKDKKIIKDTLSIRNLKKGDFYQIKIKGINLNLWQISVNSKDTVLTTPLKTPIFTDISSDGLTSLLGNLTEITSSSAILFPNEYNNIQKTKKNNENAKYIKLLIVSLEEYQKILKENISLITKIYGDIDNYKMKIYMAQLSAFDDNKRINKAYTFDDSVEELFKHRENLNSLVAKTNSNNETYIKFSNGDNFSQIQANANLRKADKEIKSKYSKGLATLEELRESINSKASLVLLKSIIFIKKDSSYTSLPIQFNGGAKVNVTISPRSPEYNLESTYKTTLIFPVEKNYWSIGVSFYGANLYDEKYSTIKKTSIVNDTISVYTIVKEKNQKFEIGIASLIRYGWKINKDDNIGIHLNFGAGLSLTKNIKPRILVGGGFSFGKKHSFVIDFGGITGYVNRRSNVYDLDTEYSEEPKNITVSELDFGGYFSIGYLYTF